MDRKAIRAVFRSVLLLCCAFALLLSCAAAEGGPDEETVRMTFKKYNTTGGMVLAAKDDKMPDCVSIPEPKPQENETDEGTVEVEINVISDEELRTGETGDLGMDFEKKEPEPKPAKTKKVRLPSEKGKKSGKLSIFWNTFIDKSKEVGESIYDFINEE